MSSKSFPVCVLDHEGAKNFLGMAKISAHNVYVNVDANGMGVCAVDDSIWLSPETADIYANNTCITATGDMYHDSHCSPEVLPISTDRSFGNTFMSDKPAAFSCGGANLSLAAFQAAGGEAGSTQKPMPTVAEVVGLGKELLGI
eukprot:SAG22_NODE_54_length_23787_cov_12.917511_15_plen_144_part_00